MFSYKLYFIGKKEPINKAMERYSLPDDYDTDSYPTRQKKFKPELFFSRSFYKGTPELKRYKAAQSLSIKQDRLRAKSAYSYTEIVAFTPAEENFIRAENLFILPTTEVAFISQNLPFAFSPEGALSNLKEAFAVICVDSKADNLDNEKKNLKEFLKTNPKKNVFLMVVGEACPEDARRISSLLEEEILEDNKFIINSSTRSLKELIKRVIKLRAELALPALLKTMENVLHKSITGYLYGTEELRKTLAELQQISQNPGSTLKALSLANNLVNRTQMVMNEDRKLAEILLGLAAIAILTAIISVLIFCPAGLFPLMVVGLQSTFAAVLNTIIIVTAAFLVSTASVCALSCKFSDKEENISQMKAFDLPDIEPEWVEDEELAQLSV